MKGLTLLLALLWLLPASAERTLHLYIDADFTGARASSRSIEQGIRTALSEVDQRIAGYPVELVLTDHRGNSGRSKLNLERYLNDKNALALYSGLHSPPLLANRELINTRGVLVLDPWAAAGPITRYPAEENWIFRLSVDDTKAGFVLAEHAVKKRGFKRPALLLENTGWGKSNQRTMGTSLESMQIAPPKVFWFNWNIKENAARIMLRQIAQSGADSILLVANAPEAKTLIRAAAALPEEQRLPFVSHWGLTGGDFFETIGRETLDKIDLAFIQTRFSFISQPEDPRGQRVLAQAAALFPNEIDRAADIKAPTGFIHAYDLTRILIAASEETQFSGDILEDRRRLRQALEQLKQPVSGLIKRYQKPFSRYSQDNPDAHEALGKEDFAMARYGANGEIQLLE